jgi:tricarballylate dehydrogenase
VQTNQPQVIVVGAGNAALVAALAAHESGARVIVLEAAPYEERGGNSRFAGAIFRMTHTGMASLRPLLDPENAYLENYTAVEPYTAGEYYNDIMDMADGRSNPELIRTLVEESFATAVWMRDQGVRWELSTLKFIKPEQLSETTPYVLPPGGTLRAVGNGQGLVHDLFAAVEKAGIEVRYSTPAHDLITSGSRVRGVRVRLADEFEDIYGTVVLASGGFEANREMRLRYLGAGWDLVKLRGARFNSGHMLERALAAGAAAAGHWGGCHATPLAVDAPDIGDLRITDKSARHSYPYGLLVNSSGRRFIDEGEQYYLHTYAKTGAAILAQPNAYAVQIFDQKTVGFLQPRYSTQTPVVADTIEDLAQQLGLPTEALMDTVINFNAAVPSPKGFDPLIEDGLGTRGVQPPKSNWAVTLDSPPFVAYPVTCGITFTYGGLAIDTAARVLDTEGRPMEGLFATGELTGGFFYNNYPGGSGLMRGAVFGILAGRNAAASLLAVAR